MSCLKEDMLKKAPDLIVYKISSVYMCVRLRMHFISRYAPTLSKILHQLPNQTELLGLWFQHDKSTTKRVFLC